MSENKPDLMAELAACPFCGGGSWIVEVPDTRRFRPQCSKCGADLGEFKRRADAVTAWNKRTHHAELEAVVRKAARYDWLRDRLAGADHVRELVGYNHGMYPKLREEVDSEIDQAMHNSAREG